MTGERIKVLTEAGVMNRMRRWFRAMKQRGMSDLPHYRRSREAREIHRQMFAEGDKGTLWVEVDPGSIEAIRAQERGWALEE